MHLAYGEPLRVPPDADDDTLEAAAKKLEAELYRINAQADAVFGFNNQERL